MADVTQILTELECSGPQSAERLLSLVYDELRALAARKLIHERPGQTLQATALVHEAYLRLVGDDKAKKWHGRAHFFAAAAEAMRRILINRAETNDGSSAVVVENAWTSTRSPSWMTPRTTTCWQSTRH